MKLRDLELGQRKLRTFSLVRKTEKGDLPMVVQIRILFDEDLIDARLAAEAFLAERDPDGKAGETRKDLIEEARQLEVLSRALIDPADGTAWSTPADLRGRLLSVEIAVLWKAYEEWQENQGPLLNEMSYPQYVAMVKQVSEEASLLPLLLLASSTRRAFIIAMAKDLSLAMTAKSSSTSASKDGSPSSGTPKSSATPPTPAWAQSPASVAEPKKTSKRPKPRAS